MSGFLNIARWEGFKLRHRRMPWVLLAVLMAFTQLAVWGSYRSYNIARATSGEYVQLPAEVMSAMPGMRRGYRCEELRTKPTEVLPAGVPPQAVALLLVQCEQQLVIRYNLLNPVAAATTALGVVGTIGIVLLGILSASAFGAEYGLGTLRPILLRGVGRQSYLSGKFLILAAAATGAVLLAVAAAALSGELIKGMAIPPPNHTAVSGSWSEVAISLVRVWAALLAFLTIAGSITLLTRSTAAGMSVSLGLYLFEALFIRLMSVAFSWFEKAGDYLPVHNINALARSAYNIAPGGLGGSPVSTTHAAIVVALYVLLFAGAAMAVFRRRDVVGISGG